MRPKRITPAERAKQFLETQEQPKGLSARPVSDTIGKGVFTDVPRSHGDFLLLYKGLFVEEEDIQDDTYVYELSWKGHKYWIDASYDDGSLGRLMNDEWRSPNCVAKILSKTDLPVVAFFAAKDIPAGSELRYCYGPGSYPWRQMKRVNQLSLNDQIQQRRRLDDLTFCGLHKECFNVGKVERSTSRKNLDRPVLTEASVAAPKEVEVQEERPVSREYLDRPVLTEASVAATGDVEVQEERSVSREYLDRPVLTEASVAATGEVEMQEERSVSREYLDIPVLTEASVAATGEVEMQEERSVSREYLDRPVLTEASVAAPGGVEVQEERSVSREYLDRPVLTEASVAATGEVEMQEERSVSREYLDRPVLTEASVAATGEVEMQEERSVSREYLDRPVLTEASVAAPGEVEVQEERSVSREYLDRPVLTEASVAAPGEVEVQEERSVSREYLDRPMLTEASVAAPGEVEVQEERSVSREYLDRPVLTEASVAAPGGVEVQEERSVSREYLDIPVLTEASVAAPGEVEVQEERSVSREYFDRPMLTEASVAAPGGVEMQEERSVSREYLDRPVLTEASVAASGEVEMQAEGQHSLDQSRKRKRNAEQQPAQYRFSDSGSSTFSETESEFVPDSDTDSDYSTTYKTLSTSLDVDMIENTSVESRTSRSELTAESVKDGQKDSVGLGSLDTDSDYYQTLGPVTTSQKEVDMIVDTSTESRTSRSELTPKSTQSSISVSSSDNCVKRRYDKRFYCLYCSKPQAKLPRHLLTQHIDETEVAKYNSSTDQKAKSSILCKLRNLGNHIHNCKVIRENAGTLIVAYRTAGAHSYEDYVPCENCLGYYVYWDLWKHLSRCQLRLDDKKSKGRVVANSRLLLPTLTNASIGLSGVLATLNTDSVSRVVKSDQLIIKLGEKLFLKLGHDRDQYSVIRNTLRELARILVILRKTVGPMDAELTTFIDPLHFKTVVCAAREVAGFNEETHLFLTPSLALKLGHSLKKCAKILKGDALQSGDETALKKVNGFYDLCVLNWTDEISIHALRTLGENKRNKVKLVPLTSDCKKLSSYLNDAGLDAYKALQISPTNKEAWADLSGVTLTQVLLFNRRRQGEVSKMTLSDFQGKHNTVQTEIMQSLSPLEQKLCEALSRIEIVGKRGRTVPVILTRAVEGRLNLLVETRDKVGICEDNTFMFARVNGGSLGHIRASDCLRHFSEECGAEYPKLLRSTKLRKQIATLSQLLNLKDNELDILANFLGHDIRVHREFYRLPESTLQIAKVSKLLFSLENGQFSTQSGKSLDEITVGLDEDIGVEVETHEESEESEEDDEEPISKKQPAGADAESLRGSVHKFGKRVWSEGEKAAVMRHFERHIQLHQLPGKKEIDMCKEQESVLQRRAWRNIKDFIRNKISTLKAKKNK